MSPDGSLLMLLGRVGVSLAVVLGLVWAAARIAARRGAGGGPRGGTARARSNGPMIELVERRAVGRRSNLVVVRVGGRALLVGATDQRVDLVAELPHLDESSDGIAVVELDSPDALDLRTGADRTTSSKVSSKMSSKVSLADAVRDLTVRR